ncbi:MAG: hypothetical protein C5B53_02595 [Candidatus Melainabacteria bacterium]|nr:MAG: hypothetical protein C5B53_02595 [Candidatus Melainabacteria bacterium]
MGDRLSSSAENTTKSEVDRHLRDCENCRAWAEQSDQIVNLTKEIPQFDVPEAVTQRILQAVAEENKPSFLSNDYGIWLGAAAVTTLAVFVLSDTVENLEGLASWSVGLAVIMIVRLVILRFPSPKAVHQ